MSDKPTSPQPAVEIGVVEDSDEDFGALMRAIRGSGMAITAERWSSAEHLLRQLEADPPRTRWPRLLLIDLNLPGLDGIKLVARLRAGIETRPLPLFILSGSVRPKDVDRGYAAGASLYLKKPLTREQVRAAVALLEAAPRGRPS